MNHWQNDLVCVFSFALMTTVYRENEKERKTDDSLIFSIEPWNDLCSDLSQGAANMNHRSTWNLAWTSELSSWLSNKLVFSQTIKQKARSRILRFFWFIQTILLSNCVTKTGFVHNFSTLACAEELHRWSCGTNMTSLGLPVLEYLLSTVTTNHNCSSLEVVSMLGPEW